jgi:hypothetical protein
MNTPEPTMDLQARREADRKLAEMRRDARRDYERYAKQEADAERDYRKVMAVAFANAKSEELSDKRAEMEAKSATADLRHRRDIAHSLAFSARMRIAELERDAVSVRDIHATSERIDGVVAA